MQGKTQIAAEGSCAIPLDTRVSSKMNSAAQLANFLRKKRRVIWNNKHHEYMKLMQWLTSGNKTPW